MDGWAGDGITSFAATRPPSWGLWQDDSVVEIHLFLICDRTLPNYFCLSLYLFSFYNVAFIDCFFLFETTSNMKEYMNITQVSIFSSFSHHHHHHRHQEMPTIEPSSVFSDGLIIDPPLSPPSQFLQTTQLLFYRWTTHSFKLSTLGHQHHHHHQRHLCRIFRNPILTHHCLPVVSFARDLNTNKTLLSVQTSHADRLAMVFGLMDGKGRREMSHAIWNWSGLLRNYSLLLIIWQNQAKSAEWRDWNFNRASSLFVIDLSAIVYRFMRRTWLRFPR